MKSIILFLLFIPYLGIGQNEIQVSDLTKIKTAGNVQITPDGKNIIYTVQAIEPDAKDKWDYNYVTQIWMADVSGNTSPRQLTYQKDGANNPRISPDGKSIAFTRSVDGKGQIFILPMDGGEPWQLTTEKNGAGNPVWFPDGQAILFSSSIKLIDLITDSILNPKKELPEWPTEKAGFKDNSYLSTNTAKANPDGSIDQIRAYLSMNEKDNKAKVITKLNLQEEARVSNDMSFNHIYQIEVKPQAKSFPLTSGFYSFANPQFIEGTNEILVQTDLDKTEPPDRSFESEVYRLSLANHSLTKVLGKQGMSYGQATISPSGKWIAFTQSPILSVSVPKLSIMPLNGKESDIMIINHDRNVNSIQFSEDDKNLFITSASNGGVALYLVDLATKAVHVLSSFDEGIGSIDFSKDKIAFSKIAVASPSELFLADTKMQNQKLLTDLNTSWLKTKTLSTPQKYSFKNEKGLTVEYWVMKPTHYTPGKKYPAMLEIHGGPTAMWGPGEASMWHEFQYYCGKGYVVVYANPRGSGGYGENFMRANIKDWGAGPTSDVLKSLDAAVSLGFIDTAKLAVTGGSYAGYLIAWIISHDNRFKAACSQRGVYDLTTFFGEGNAWRLVPMYFGGYPWQPEVLKILEHESPITYVQNINTPYLMFHGENDLRTGVIQGEQMYKSLKVMGKSVEYVRHPGATHEITRSGNNRQRIDQMLRAWEFFDRFIH
ncbi:MAG: S9 family peptidase [Saprospiraceae bacterium]